MARHGHVAVVYRTYSYEQCAAFVEIDICAVYNKANQTCPKCAVTDANVLERDRLVDERKASGLW